ncbi:MAG: AAA family ATPase [Candidatus Margulisbacteria bacterium]|nr:AAA family ATPase [Candidatus Margulisiibacteriota bacterium]
MINKIKVDGFKSLSNISLTFTKGLNVLIGPNGSGKTNLCQIFGLISANVRGRILHNILSLGGVNSIFTKSKLKGKRSINVKSKLIKIWCQGELKEERVSLRYIYSFSIRMKENIMIEKEKIVIDVEKESGIYKKAIEISQPSPNNPNKFKIKVVPKLMGPNQLKKFKKSNKNEIILKTYASNKSIFAIGSYLFKYCFMVEQDIKASDVLDIDPHIAKKPSDILEPTKMYFNGKGLSNAIYNMSKNQPNSLKAINEFLSKIYPRHKLIEPHTKDGESNTFVLVDKNGTKCFAQNISDGTIKTLGLLVGMMTHRHNTLIIEELENYLHPWACQIFINRLREISKNKVYILTTHSETILNNIKPKEVIICNNVGGGTTAVRMRDIKQLENTIKYSGFGVGYHYVGGLLGGTPQND